MPELQPLDRETYARVINPDKSVKGILWATARNISEGEGFFPTEFLDHIWYRHPQAAVYGLQVNIAPKVDGVVEDKRVAPRTVLSLSAQGNLLIIGRRVPSEVSGIINLGFARHHTNGPVVDEQIIDWVGAFHLRDFNRLPTAQEYDPLYKLYQLHKQIFTLPFKVLVPVTLPG